MKRTFIKLKRGSELSDKIYTVYSKINESFDPNGRYLIKFNELKDVRGWKVAIKNKSYFCYANAGFSYSYDKKDPEIYKTNKKRDAVRYAKLCAFYMGYRYLVSVVDRKDNGNEITFLIPKHDFFINRLILK